jgi:transcriptional regulator with XRE-family HTH domain
MAAAERLGVERNTVSTWRTGRSMPGPEHVNAMCEAVGEPVAVWLPLIEAERTSDPKASAIWLKITKAAMIVSGASVGITELTQML